MHIRIVVRTADPAGAAAFARALGIEIDEPNRPNPDRWHRRMRISLVIAGTEDGEPGIHIGPDDFDEAVAGIADLVGPSGLSISADGRTAVVDSPTGHSFVLERDAPVAETYDLDDVGSQFRIMPIFRWHRERIAAALADLGLTNPRLAGQHLGRIPRRNTWMLVVDGPVGTDVTSIDRLLAELSDGFDDVTVRLSSSIAPEHLAEIDRKAFDV